MNSREQSNGTSPAKRDHRQEVTDSIIKLLEEGVAAWQKPWESAGLPFNPTTGKTYKGGNALHLMTTGLSRGYEDPRWLTYKQAAENEWQVRKGEKGTHIEFWEVKTSAAEKDGKGENAEQPERDGRNSRRLIHRIYTVFNAKQIDGIPEFERPNRGEFEIAATGERILSSSAANIAHDQRDSAFYRPSTDSIHLPPKDAFSDAPGYYGTALHELAHWTGHPSRLNRPTLNESYRFGDLNYAKEELRAELASVFIAAEVGIPHDAANHAAYVGSWIKALKEDKNEIFRAAHDASAATDFVLGLERELSRADAIEIADADGEVSQRAQRLRDETENLADERDLIAAPTSSSLDEPNRETSAVAARFEPLSGTVGVYNKQSGSDRHTPVEQIPASNNRALAHSDAIDRETLSLSFGAAKNIAAAKLGETARTFVAQTQSGAYRGEIIGATDLHVIQRLSPQSAVAHMKHLLTTAPEVGARVGIAYKDEVGSVRELREKSRERELTR